MQPVRFSSLIAAAFAVSFFACSGTEHSDGVGQNRAPLAGAPEAFRTFARCTTDEASARTFEVKVSDATDAAELVLDGAEAVRGRMVNADERDPFILEYAFERWSVDIVLERTDDKYPGSFAERDESDGSTIRTRVTCEL